MIIDRQVDVFGDVRLMSVPPDAIYAELAERKGLTGKIARSPEFTKQNEILDDRSSRWKALNCTRRGAKSTTEAMDHVEVCQETCPYRLGS